MPDGRARFAAADLASWRGHGHYDLVTASFFHSPVDLPRTDVLRQGAGVVSPGGYLLIVSHAAFPPWAERPDHHEHRFLTPEEEIDALRLDPDGWEVLLAETRSRDALAPDGKPAVLDDAVVLLRRR